MRELLLQLGDVKETCVGSMEEGNPQREPYAHEEVLDVVRENSWDRPANGICDLRKNPVRMKECNGSERQRQTANLENRMVAVEPAKGHAREDESRPYAGIADEEDANPVPSGRTGRERVQGDGRRVHFDGDKLSMPWLHSTFSFAGQGHCERGNTRVFYPP